MVTSKNFWLTLIALLLPLASLPADSLDIQLNTYLRALRQHRITAFPTQGQFLQVNDTVRPFRRHSGGITLITQGNELSQQITEIRICILNPLDRLQRQRWLNILIASLAIFSREESDIQRMLAIQRTLEQGSFQLNHLLLTSGKESCGQYIHIESAKSSSSR
ncbi:hypothetical protein PVA45_03500 [Entomospira entomophila]|uniref:Uncharacterized protein n=1 Tax=Entomospira entomophila TaxID=2719988 RepID=A0A968KTQ4_9SPIO|nr:hypothetical protein [Entomospira entomophilus]NIZ40576.1 hypothetical protein [Entomospira entomophilus]WDI36134.1 hypothetical protein PVA45_03500 [Entomospira entomophilus]